MSTYISRKREKVRPISTNKLSDVFKDVSDPIYYRVTVMEDRGESWKIVNWGDCPRLVISIRTPNGFTNILNVRLTIEGIEKGKKRLEKALKLLETLEKFHREGKITLRQEMKFEEKPINIEDALAHELDNGQ
jgi:hypothetical protein